MRRVRGLPDTAGSLQQLTPQQGYVAFQMCDTCVIVCSALGYTAVKSVVPVGDLLRFADGIVV